MASSGSALDKVINFSPMDVLFKEGDAASFVHILKRGRVLILKKNTKSVITPIMVLTAPCVPDDFIILKNEKHHISAIALTDCEALLVKHSEMNHVIKQMPDWTMNVMNTISEKLHEACEMIIDNAIQDEEVSEAWLKYSKSILGKLK
jgi:CRP-like cAMP-binding protein